MKHQCKTSTRQTVEINHNENLFRALRNAAIQIAYACDGEGICGKCWVFITPTHHVSTESPLEQKIKQANALPENARISCLTKVIGPIEITAPYW